MPDVEASERPHFDVAIIIDTVAAMKRDLMERLGSFAGDVTQLTQRVSSLEVLRAPESPILLKRLTDLEARTLELSLRPGSQAHNRILERVSALEASTMASSDVDNILVQAMARVDARIDDLVTPFERQLARLEERLARLQEGSVISVAGGGVGTASHSSHVWRSPLEFLSPSELAHARSSCTCARSGISSCRSEPPSSASPVTRPEGAFRDCDWPDFESISDDGLFDWACTAGLLSPPG